METYFNYWFCLLWFAVDCYLAKSFFDSCEIRSRTQGERIVGFVLLMGAWLIPSCFVALFICLIVMTIFS